MKIKQMEFIEEITHDDYEVNCVIEDVNHLFTRLEEALNNPEGFEIDFKGISIGIGNAIYDNIKENENTEDNITRENYDESNFRLY